MLRLRCKAKNGTHVMQGLTQQSSVQELMQQIQELTGIPQHLQKILVGYPPSGLDLHDAHAHLTDHPIQSGDTLIVEEERNKPRPPVEAEPVMERRPVPADNSCLFTSVSYVLDGGVFDPRGAGEMRDLIAQVVAGAPAAYSEAVLGRSNSDYCAWIRRRDTWGGAIELAVLARFYRCEVCVVDTQTGRVDRFGEDSAYSKRVLLIYDGIHYDPLQRVWPASDTPPQTVFSSADDVVLAQAQELAEEARRRRLFTDVERFALRCLVCQSGLRGQEEARQHAKDTGHASFGEV